MGQLKSIDLPEPGGHSATAVPRATPSKSRWWVWILLLGVVAVGVWYFRNSRGGSQAADSAAPAANKGRGVPGAGNFAVPVVVATAQHGELPVYFNGLGTVTAFNTVTVRSRVDGQLISVAFKEGVIPQQQLDTQAASVGQFDGAIKTDQAQIDNAKLQLTYSRITAPISGRIGLRLVDAGNIVHAGDTNGLLVITQLQPISVIFSLPQDQLPQVNAKLRSGVVLVVEAYDRDDTDKIATGKLVTIDNQIDPTTGTYKLKSIFGNENTALFPNQFVNVHLLVDTKRNLTIVPTPAIQRGPQGSYVYAVGKDNVVKIHTVTAAQTTGNSVGLSDGLNPGDIVVIDGQDKLQDGSKVLPNFAAGANGAGRGSGPQPSGSGAARSGSPSSAQPGGSPR